MTMSGARRKRLYESFFGKTAAKRYEKHTPSSSIVDLDAELEDDDWNASTDLRTPISERRRRRIYEAEFNRPYPVAPRKSKRSLLRYFGVAAPSSPELSTPPGSPKKMKNKQPKSPPSQKRTSADRRAAAAKLARPAYDMQPCNSLEGVQASTIPSHAKLVRAVTPLTSSTGSSRGSSPIEVDIDQAWISTERKETPEVIDLSLDMKPCNLWEGSQSPSVPPRELLVREELPTPSARRSPCGEENLTARQGELYSPPIARISPSRMDQDTKRANQRGIATNLYSTPVAEISPTTKGHAVDEAEHNMIMMVTPPSPHSKGIPNPFDISPLTYNPVEFVEPPAEKEAPPNLVQPPLSEVVRTQKNPSIDAVRCLSFQEAPTMESDKSLEKFMKINEDDTLTLYVDDIQEATFDRIIESLYGNTSINVVTVVRTPGSAVGDYRTPHEMKCLWDAIRCLSNLEFLVVVNIQQEVLPDLSDILPSYRGSRFQLHMAEGSPTPRFLKALARAPKLKHLQIHANESINIGLLLESTSLLNVRIVSGKFQMDDHHMQLFADRLARNESSVRKIDLEPTLSTVSMTGLACALRYNRTVKSLRLSYDNSLGDNDTVVAEVSNMLYHNRTLTELANYSHESIWVSGETKDNVIKKLRGNGVITLFKFFHEEPMFWVAKESVLKGNKNGGARGRATQFVADFRKYWNCGSLLDIDMGCDIRLPV